MAAMSNVVIIPSSQANRFKARITATVDGEIKTILEYFDDEISFSASELEGREEEYARELFFRKDKAYLQS